MIINKQIFRIRGSGMRLLEAIKGRREKGMEKKDIDTMGKITRRPKRKETYIGSQGSWPHNKERKKRNQKKI